MLKREVRLSAGAMIIARAFSELSTCRAIGFSVGPIPWDAMLLWCRYHNLRRDVTDHLINTVMHIDAIYSRRVAADAANKKPPAPGAAAPPRAPKRKG